MCKKINLNLLILCGCLYREIFGTFLEDNINRSSKIHFRRKRLIDDTITGYIDHTIKRVPYIVKVLQNHVKICAGIIVSPEHILTAKICADEPKAIYSVESGELFRSPVQAHLVVNIIFKGQLALLLINPPIFFESPSLNRNILLHEENVRALTHVSISGWRSAQTVSQNGEQTAGIRRSMLVPIIGMKTCSMYYKKFNYTLTHDNICTLEKAGQKGCTYEDGGSALVLTGKLLGVLVFAGRIVDTCAPDVFIRVNNYNAYHNWIMSHIGPYLHNQMNIQPLPTLHPNHHHPHNQ